MISKSSDVIVSSYGKIVSLKGVAIEINYISQHTNYSNEQILIGI